MILLQNNEVWKDVYWKENGKTYDYRGLYKISNFGRVYGVKNGKIKTLRVDKSGYFTVSLYKDNKEKNCKVHRLVALHFIDGYFEKAVVNHIDENKQNNHHTNLEWCTVAYNNSYNDKDKRVCKKVDMYSKDGIYIKTFNSVNEAAEYFNKSVGNLVSHLKGRQKTFANHIFRYTERE